MDSEIESIKSYFSCQLSKSIDNFLFGDMEEAKHFLMSADSDLEAIVGVEIRSKILNELDPNLVIWKAQMLSSDFSIEICANTCPQIVLIHDSLFQSEEDLEISSNDKDLALQKIFELYEEDKLHDAFSMYNEIKDVYKISLKNHPNLSELIQDWEEISLALKSFDDNEGWITESQDENIEIRFKQIPGTPTVSMLTEGELDVGMFNVVTMLYEIDLYTEWVPFCNKSQCLHKLSRSRMIAMQEYGVRGLATKQTLVYGYGCNLLQSRGFIMIVSKSCDDSSHFKGVELPIDPNVGRAKVNYCGFILKPISRTKTYLKLLTNFDPCIPIIPYSILNWFTRKYSKGFFEKIANNAKNFEGSKWQTRMESPENYYFYRHMGNSLEEYFSSIDK